MFNGSSIWFSSDKTTGKVIKNFRINFSEKEHNKKRITLRKINKICKVEVGETAKISFQTNIFQLSPKAATFSYFYAILWLKIKAF